MQRPASPRSLCAIAACLWKPLPLAVAVFVVGLLPLVGQSDDWPMWRYDGRRSASTPQELPADLQPQWSISQPAPRLAWPEDPRLHFDASLEPIVAGKTMFVASSRNDALTAINTETGETRWTFFAGGPIRFAPVAHDGRLYFGADDGFFYCLNADNGSVAWKFRAAPSQRRVIGNERITSAWPIRGGQVRVDDRIYFTVGVWPFEGTQLVEVQIDDSDEPQWRTVMIPDNVTPQGYLAIDGQRLLIPSGRDRATGFDVATRKFLSWGYQSRGKTDYHVTTEGDFILHGERIYEVATKKLLPNVARRPVSTREAVFGTWEGHLVAYHLTDPVLVERKDKKGSERALRPFWSISKEALAAATGQSPDTLATVELRAGQRLYGIHGKTLFAVNDAKTDEKPAVTWTTAIDGTPTRLIAADDKLFVATREGHIHCFGATEGDHSVVQAQPSSPAAPEAAKRVAEWLAGNSDTGGYCLVLGAASTESIDELVRQSEMHIVVLDPAVDKIDALRRRYDDMQLYGTRVSAIVGDLATAQLPPYVMSLAVCESVDDWQEHPELAAQVHHCLRPYGGRAVFVVDADSTKQLEDSLAESQLPQAELTAKDGFALLTRPGPLPGAADWTHEYGDPSNSLMSQDELVKAPLGALWFGGPAAASDLFFNRHYWPPSLTVSQGRMFFQGPQVFVGVDIYTGRVLWRKELPKGISPGRRGNFFEKVRVGYHFLAADDAVYLSVGGKCEMLDPATGEVKQTFRLEDPDSSWGTMRLWEDRLICTVFRPDKDGQPKPLHIVALDRQTGKQLWQHDAKFTAPVAALGGKRVFYYDGALEGLYDAWKRKGLVPKSTETGYLTALDIETGKPVWEAATKRAVTWLGVSSSDGILVAANKLGVEAWNGKTGEPMWDKQQDGKGFRGHPEELWDKVILWNDRIIDQRGPGLAYDVKTGDPLMKEHPLTGEQVPWEFTKTGHHCNYAIANPHMLTFRADTAGFLDLETGTTGRLNGFRSGCRNSLIPAGGVLNAPNFAHGCVCSYSLFTSLALVHTPSSDVWTYNAYKAPKEGVQRIGVNLGAPGDRQAESGTLWLDHPNVGGPSPKVNVSVSGNSVKYFCGHSLAVAGDQLPWVAASGCEGLQTIKVQLGEAKTDRACRVKLYFAEPDQHGIGERVFNVALQGEQILDDFDIREAAGARNQVLVRSFDCVASNNTVELTFTPSSGQPLLCGLEIVMVDE